jgi:hypothetical protein
MDRESVPPELLPTYDALVDAYKSIQKGLTPKLQEAAAAVEERDALAAQVEALTAQVAAIGTLGQPQYADPSDESQFYSGLGNPLSFDAVLASDDPKALHEYIEQRTMVNARKVGKQIIDFLGPQVGQVAQTMSAQQESAMATIANNFLAANPDVAPFRGEIGRMLSSGLASDMDDAAAKVRAIHFSAKQTTEAFELGAKARAARDEQVRDNKGRFSVPAGSTASKGGPALSPEASVRDILTAATADIAG